MQTKAKNQPPPHFVCRVLQPCWGCTSLCFSRVKQEERIEQGKEKKMKLKNPGERLKIGSIYFTSTFPNSCWLFTIISPCSAGAELNSLLRLLTVHDYQGALQFLHKGRNSQPPSRGNGKRGTGEPHDLKRSHQAHRDEFYSQGASKGPLSCCCSHLAPTNTNLEVPCINSPPQQDLAKAELFLCCTPQG